jgi:NADH dehydrogenase
MHWSVSFVGRGRSERTATYQQVVARNELQRMHGGEVESRSSLGTTSQSLEGLRATDRTRHRPRTEPSSSPQPLAVGENR